MTEAKAAATIAEEALASAQAGSEAQGNEDKKANPGDGGSGAAPDSFATEDAALEAMIAEQAKLDAEAAGKVTEKTKEGETAGSTGEVKEGDAAAAKAKADATAAAAAAATNPQTQAIIALRKQNSELRGALLVKEGETRALKAMVGTSTKAEGEPDGAQTPGEPTIEDAIVAIETERETLAAKVDAGQLTMVEYTKQVNVLGRKERELMLAEAEAMAQSAASARPTSDLGLEEATNAILTEYPVLAKLTKAQLDPVNALAYEQFSLEGKPIVSDSPSETKRLRERMADLAEQFYDQTAHAARQAKKAAASTGQAKPAAGNVTALPTAAQREAKLALAASMPPEVGKTGTGATAGEFTEEQVAAALSGNEDQRLAFMDSHPALIQKVMGPGYRIRK